MNPNDVYTHGHHDSVLRSHRSRTVANSAAYLIPHLRPGAEVLDIGCGPGTITADLAERVAPGRVLGVDRAPDVVEAARVAFPSLEFAVGDAYALTLDADEFDVVHAHQVLQHLSDPVAALREWARVVRPGGVVAARDADYEAFTWFPADPRLNRWLDLYRAAARENQAEPDAGRRVLSWARAAGFTDVEATGSVWCYAEPRSRGWWSDLWAERITDSPLAKQLVDGGRATTSDLEGIAAAWREWGMHDDAWFLVPHGEIVCRVS